MKSKINRIAELITEISNLADEEDINELLHIHTISSNLLRYQQYLLKKKNEI